MTREAKDKLDIGVIVCGFLIILFGFLWGLQSISEQVRINEFPETTSQKGFSVKIIEIDGCEYLLARRHLAHKGNCKNSSHIDNQSNTRWRKK